MKLIFAVLYVSWTTGLTRCCITLDFYIYICSFSTIFCVISVSDTCLRSRLSISKPNFDKISTVHGWYKTTSGLGKRTAAILEFYLRFRFRPMHSHRHVILHLPAKFCINRTIVGGGMTSYRFFKMAAIESEVYFRFMFSDGICLRRWTSICIPNFNKITQSTTEI